MITTGLASRNMNLSKFFLLFLGLVVSIIAYTLSNNTKTIKLVIQANISDGKSIELFYNSKFSTNSIIKNSDSIYVFSNLPPNLKNVRIDPTDKENTNFKIHKIELLDTNNTVLKTIHPREFNEWKYHGITVNNIIDDSIDGTSESNDPIITLPDQQFIYMDSDISSLLTFISTITDNFHVEKFWFLAILILLCLNIRSIYSQILLISFVVFFGFNNIVVEALKKILPENFPDASRVIGYVNYFTFPKGNDKLLFFIPLLLQVLLVFFIYQLLIRRFQSKESQVSLSSEKSTQKTINKVALCFVYSLFALYIFPRFSDVIVRISSGTHDSQWDSINILTWNFMYSKGFLPIKDYFYPYGGQFIMSGPDTKSIFLGWVHECILGFLLIASIYKSTRQSLQKTILILLFIAVLILNGYIQSAARYFTGAIAGLYIVINWNKIIKSWISSFLAAVILTWVLFYEPNQLINTFFGFFIFGVWTLATEMQFGKFFSSIIKPGACFLLLSSLYIYLLYKNDTLAKFLLFYTTLGDLATNGALPNDTNNWFSDSFNKENITVLLIFTLSTLAITEFKKLKNNIYIIPLLAFTIVLFLKQLIRPHIEHQLIGTVILAGLIFLSNLYQDNFNKTQKLLSCFLVGIAVGAATCKGVIPSMISQLSGRVYSLKNDIRVLVQTFDDSRKIQELYFAPKKFLVGQKTAEEFNTFIDKKYGKDSKIIAFGQNPTLYVIRNQKTPYYLTFYDGATATLQHQKSLEIESMNPNVIVWNPQDDVFDSVPVIVKNSIEFMYLIKNYEFSSSFEQYHLLTKKNAKKIDFNYWRNNLGNSINLGGLPSVTTISNLNCDSTQTDCIEFLEVEFLNDTKATIDQKIEIKIGTLFFTIKFKNYLHKEKILIRLDRIWFWQIAKENQIPRELLEQPNIRLKTIFRKISPDIMN